MVLFVSESRKLLTTSEDVCAITDIGADERKDLVVVAAAIPTDGMGVAHCALRIFGQHVIARAARTKLGGIAAANATNIHDGAGSRLADHRACANADWRAGPAPGRDHGAVGRDRQLQSDLPRSDLPQYESSMSRHHGVRGPREIRSKYSSLQGRSAFSRGSRADRRLIPSRKGGEVCLASQCLVRRKATSVPGFCGCCEAETMGYK